MLKVLDQSHFYLRTWPEAFRGTWGLANELAELNQKKFTLWFLDPFTFMGQVGTRDLQLHKDIARRLGLDVPFPPLGHILKWRGPDAEENFAKNVAFAGKLKEAIEQGDYSQLPWPSYPQGEEPKIHHINLLWPL